ncbi:FMN-binding negative transcriptional regulator [Caulobacter sp. LjRoot300]|uniref:FMN-binding negative transcriptional regulator n=1 Tax=Caulobacter sp. LjRoot300 TaxID=3342321 RepID=UPI003ED108ED
MTEASMFVPPLYRAEDPAGIVEAHPFALLVTGEGGDLHATATPIFFEREGEHAFLVGHMARRNAHAQSLAAGQSALAVFWGPHAYISSRWYAAKPEAPTWNYVQAQARGVLEPIDDPARQRAILTRTAEVLERRGEPPWTLDQAPDGRVDLLLPMIRSFRIQVTRLEGATKLSQGHPAQDRLRVIAGLLAEDRDGGRDIARLMATGTSQGAAEP